MTDLEKIQRLVYVHAAIAFGTSGARGTAEKAREYLILAGLETAAAKARSGASLDFVLNEIIADCIATGLLPEP